jgi:hypothetical protein
MLRGDMSGLVYKKAFILTSGMDYDEVDDDVRKHITNLSVNKHFANHPGQIPCFLSIEYPEVIFISYYCNYYFYCNYYYYYYFLI